MSRLVFVLPGLCVTSLAMVFAASLPHVAAAVLSILGAVGLAGGALLPSIAGGSLDDAERDLRTAAGAAAIALPTAMVALAAHSRGPIALAAAVLTVGLAAFAAGRGWRGTRRTALSTPHDEP